MTCRSCAVKQNCQILSSTFWAVSSTASPVFCISLPIPLKVSQPNSENVNTTNAIIKRIFLTILPYPSKMLLFPWFNILKNKTIIIALTNRPDLLGGAMMRRFDFRIYVPPPDYNTISTLLEHLLSKLGIAIDFASREWHQIITSFLGFTYSEISTIVRDLIWKYYDKLVGRNTAEIILRHKLTEAIAQFTPYFANFDSLEPATFRFLDQAYGFPRSNLSRHPWEAKFMQCKHELIQTHPNPNIIYRRKYNRQL